MTTPSETPAGWYPDPSDATSERYWDGSAWTQQTQPVGTQAAPPAAAFGAPVDQGLAAAPQAPSSFGDPQATPPGFGAQQAYPAADPYAAAPTYNTPMSAGSNVLGILALVFAFVCSPVGLILGIIGLVSNSSSDQGKTFAKIGLILSIVFLVLWITVDIVLAGNSTTSSYNYSTN